MDRGVIILGISCFYHDSAAAVLRDGEIIAAAQEERFTRIKHDDSFPSHAVKFCLEEAGVTIDQLTAVVFYDKPLLKFERLLETYYSYAPKGLRSFIAAIPVWLKKKLFLKDLVYRELRAFGDFQKKKTRLLFTEHHLSHAASAYFTSPFAESAVLTIDGVGEWATASIVHAKAEQLTVLKELHFPHSLGLLYSAFTYFLGFKVNSGEYKLMGLAPYGRSGSVEVARYVDLIKSELVDVKTDGSIWLDQKYFDYATGFRMASDKRWEALFGFERRTAENELDQKHCDLALAIQIVTEEIVLLMAQEAKRLTGSPNLCMAGGVALNCVANGKLQNSGIFDHIFIQPASGDAGGALGAALAASHLTFECKKRSEYADLMQGSYLGPAFSGFETSRTLKKYDAVFTEVSNFDELARQTARLLADGKIVGWFQGKMEFGPRALGNRSILGDPRDSEMQKKLNLKIKYRESFRPFAPSVLAGKAYEYFDLVSESPYMLLVQEVGSKHRKNMPEGYGELEMREKLYTERSVVPAITHVDFSARIQTVNKERNERYWKLISEFNKLTGCPMVVNTSFNVRGEPIVCTPEDAYRCFMRTEMDYLVIGNLLFNKSEQPQWQLTDNWQEEFVLD